jgi:Phage tail assembly chaperone proteins, E, or 41 or 14
MDERTRDPIMSDADKAEPNFESTEQEQPPQLEEEVSFEHVLAKPIQAHGEELRVLRWREPTGGDIEMAGNPVYLDFSGPNPSITFNEKKMGNMISRLTQIPPSSVRQLTAKDWNAVAWKLFRFFTPPGA